MSLSFFLDNCMFIEFCHVFLHDISIFSFSKPLFTMYLILDKLGDFKKKKKGPVCGALSLHFCHYSYQIWTALVRSASLKSVFNKAILLKPLFCSLMVISLSLAPGRNFSSWILPLSLHSSDNSGLTWSPSHQLTHYDSGALFYFVLLCAFLLS